MTAAGALARPRSLEIGALLAMPATAGELAVTSA
jgi:hypothetical protein